MRIRIVNRRGLRDKSTSVMPPALAFERNQIFDRFLLEPIREDENDTPVSILSKFARIGVDPWQEAQALAILPEELSCRRLEKLLIRMGNSPTSVEDRQAYAADLITLLPTVARGWIPADSTVHKRRPGRNSVVAFMIILAVLLSSEALTIFTGFGDRYQTAAHQEDLYERR